MTDLKSLNAKITSLQNEKRQLSDMSPTSTHSELDHVMKTLSSMKEDMEKLKYENQHLQNQNEVNNVVIKILCVVVLVVSVVLWRKQ